jgi:glycosyltransferase involved in cell wall biosynthesis
VYHTLVPRVDADRGGEPGSAIIVVRNPATHDARVLREAGTLAGLGHRPLILAVVSTQVPEQRSVVEGFPVQRLAPSSPLAWLRTRLRRPSASTAGSGAEPAPTAEAHRPRGLTRLHRWLRTLDYYRRAIRTVRAERPALLHCNDYNTMWVGVAARLMGGIAVVYDAHELWPDRNLRPEPRWWLLACEWLFVRCAHITLTASPGYSEVIARRYRVQPPTVIRNIPAQALRPRRPEAEPPALGPVTYVGALTRNRGLEVAIEALALRPEARLRLLGPVQEAYRTELLALAERLAVRGRLELAEPVPPHLVLEAIEGASVGLALIQPACLSYELSLPNKLFEYVLAGVPVLGSDLPVIGEFVRTHGVGAVARADDVSDVAAKLAELLEPERNRALREAARTAAAGLDWQRESRLLADAYTDAVDRAQI